MKKRAKWIALVVALVVVGGAVALIVSRSRQTGVEIQTAVVKRQTLSSVVSASGDLAPVGERFVSPQVSGNLDELVAKDGQTVAAGQLIARIDSQPYRAAVAQAASTYEAAVAQKNTIIKSVPLSSEICAAQAQVDQTYYAYKVARMRWRRANIYKKPDAKIAMDQALTAYLSAKAALDKLLAASAIGPQVASADEAINSAAAALRKAETDLAHTSIYAPASGVLIYKTQTNPLTGETSKVGVGSGVQAGSPIASIANLGAMEFVADVDETDISKVKTNQVAVVVLDSYPDTDISGRVIQVGASAVTAKSGGTSFPVKIRLRRPKKLSLRIGMNGSADIIRAQAKNILVVPYEAVTTSGGQSAAFLIENNVARLRPIVLGLSTDTYYEVTKGLADGDTVARTKVATLKDGETVSVK